MKAIFLPRTFLCVNLLPSPSKFLQISIPFRHLFSLLAGKHFSTFFILRASRTVRRWHRVDIHCFLCASCIHRVWNWRYHRARVIRYGITRFRERKCDCLLKSHQHPQSPPTVPPTSQSFDRKLCVYVWLYCIQIGETLCVHEILRSRGWILVSSTLHLWSPSWIRPSKIHPQSHRTSQKTPLSCHIAAIKRSKNFQFFFSPVCARGAKLSYYVVFFFFGCSRELWPGRWRFAASPSALISCPTTYTTTTTLPGEMMMRFCCFPFGFTKYFPFSLVSLVRLLRLGRSSFFCPWKIFLTLRKSNSPFLSCVLMMYNNNNDCKV